MKTVAFVLAMALTATQVKAETKGYYVLTPEVKTKTCTNVEENVVIGIAVGAAIGVGLGVLSIIGLPVTSGGVVTTSMAFSSPILGGSTVPSAVVGGTIGGTAGGMIGMAAACN